MEAEIREKMEALTMDDLEGMIFYDPSIDDASSSMAGSPLMTTSVESRALSEKQEWRKDLKEKMISELNLLHEAAKKKEKDFSKLRLGIYVNHLMEEEKNWSPSLQNDLEWKAKVFLETINELANEGLLKGRSGSKVLDVYKKNPHYAKLMVKYLERLSIL